MLEDILNTMATVEENANIFCQNNAFILLYSDRITRETFALHLICTINKYSLPEWFIIRDEGIFISPIGFKNSNSAITFIKNWCLGNKLNFSNFTLISHIPCKSFAHTSTMPDLSPLLNRVTR